MGQIQQYRVEEYQGTREVRTVVLDEDGKASRGKDGLIMYETKKVSGGYIVHLPKGDSLFVKDLAGLRALGFDKDPAMVDDDGEVVPREYANPSLRSKGKNKSVTVEEKEED